MHRYGPSIIDVEDIEQMCILVVSYSEPEAKGPFYASINQRTANNLIRLHDIAYLI